MSSSELLEVVESNPVKVSGAWVFKGTRVPVMAVFENLKDGASVDEFLEWFPGVTRAQVARVCALISVEGKDMDAVTLPPELETKDARRS